MERRPPQPTQGPLPIDPTDIGPAPPDFTVARNPHDIPPSTDPDAYPEMAQIITSAIAEGRTVDATGRVDLRGLTGGGRDGEKWVIRDQFVRHDTSIKNTGPEPIPDFVIRMRGKGWQVLKGAVKGDIKPDEAAETTAGMLAETVQRGQQVSPRRIKSAWTRKPKTHKANNRYGGQFMEPILDRHGRQKKTLIPLPTQHDGYGPAPFRGAPEVKRDKRDIPMLAIDIYDKDGNLARQQEWPRKALALYFHDPENSPDYSFKSPDEVPKAPGELPFAEQESTSIPLSGRKDPYADIIHYLKGEGLPDSLVGITWDRDGHRHQVVQDVQLTERFRHKKTYAEPESVRAFVVRKYDASGNIVGHRVFRDAELRDYFKDAVTPTKKRGLEQVPKKNFRPLEHIYRKSAKTAETTPAPIMLTPWQKIQALRMLDESDIEDGDNPRRQLSEMLADPEISKYVSSLYGVVSELGLDKIKELVTKQRDAFLKAVDLLELPSAEREKYGTSWFLKEMIVQRYYADHSDEAGPEEEAKYGLDLADDARRFGYYVSDPFENNPTGVKARRRLLQREIAVHYMSAALEAAPAEKQRKDPVSDRPLFKAGTSEPLIDVVMVYKEKEKITKKLLDIVAKDAKAILNKMVGKEVDKTEPHMLDLVELGDLLLQQFPDSVLKK